MKFSVLISVYTKEKTEYLQQAIDSIVSQTVMPDEIVCVEDGELTNELHSVLMSFDLKYPGLFKFLKFKENRGLGLALRDGVLACKNEYIARMDTDDIAYPNRFEVQVSYLNEHPEIALLGSWVKEFSSNPDVPDSETRLPVGYDSIVAFSHKRNPFRHMTVFYKKSAVLESGNYRDFLWFEDYDLWVRMLQHGYKAANLPQFLVNVRAGNDMFARRGGIAYIKQDLKFQEFLKNSGWISNFEYYRNILTRSIVRIMPDSARICFYRLFLRD